LNDPSSKIVYGIKYTYSVYSAKKQMTLAKLNNFTWEDTKRNIENNKECQQISIWGYGKRPSWLGVRLETMNILRAVISNIYFCNV